MIHKNKKFDIAVVGAGPAGIAFACGFIGSNIKVAIIDKLPKKLLKLFSILLLKFLLSIFIKSDVNLYLQ